MTKSRPQVKHAPTERREALRQYVLLCIRDGSLSLSDLGSIPDRLIKLLSADLKVVIGEMAGQGAANLIQMGASWLSELARRLTG